MAAAKRFTTEQIVAKLREAEKLQAQGMSIPALCKRLQISDQIFYRWRLKYSALKVSTDGLAPIRYRHLVPGLFSWMHANTTAQRAGLPVRTSFQVETKTHITTQTIL